MHEQLIPIIAPVLLCVLLGYGWARSGVPFEREFLTRINMNIGAPCLILRGIVGLDAETPAFLMMLGFGALMLICGAIAASAVLGACRLSLRSFLPPVVFGNIGNLGLPLCLLAFGTEGLGLAVAIYLVGAVSHFILVPLVQGRQTAWTILVQTPIIYAAIVGIGLLATNATMPDWLANSVGLLAGLAIPLMLLALGHALGTIRIERVRLATGLAVLRLGIGFSVGVALVEAFELSGVARGVVLVESAMPVAVFNFLMAARYERHPEEVAGAIVISTLLSFLTMPALLLFALPR
jgi:predicted permease